MNKLLLFLFFYLPFVLQINSQGSDPIVKNTESRKVKFGLYGQGSLCWLSPEEQKLYQGMTGAADCQTLGCHCLFYLLLQLIKPLFLFYHNDIMSVAVVLVANTFTT